MTTTEALEALHELQAPVAAAWTDAAEVALAALADLAQG